MAAHDQAGGEYRPALIRIGRISTRNERVFYFRGAHQGGSVADATHSTISTTGIRRPKRTTAQVLVRGYSDVYGKEYLRKDGSVVAIENQAWLVLDENGEPRGLIGIIREVAP